MKKTSLQLIAFILLLHLGGTAFSQTEKNSLSLSINYYNNNNQTQYLVATAKSKIDGRFQMIAGIPINFYIGIKSPENLIGKGVTNNNGEAMLFIPAKAKDEWNKTSKINFTIESKKLKTFDEAEGTLEITKAKIQIDTLADRTISATLLELKDSVWIPVNATDVRIAIKRLGADLNVSEAPAYATDSLGVATAEFKQDSLPGDSKGNLVLIAHVDNHDIYGNLSSEKMVPWGKSFTYVSEFDKRTLFARWGKSPLWLELMAYSIVVAVWSILIYLFIQIKKLKKLGTA
ncbi:hypothetical protein [Sediminibacterium sp.]|uniref:hypothetical protein n=1 Tax=Sediminibacterium sp. TaxID=1917865 RepID=UPI0025D173DA|nr:hypothetical protein [Sediminibacterium sp.]